ncbi:Delta(12) fatty acid desaturase [Grifola frondosa]|uniref:Delta(12) fatty acid desaturase n=1 Tax=Grifola frondosa TaxID=5627 RepID=A0A1C7M2X8_GRIFR|nr:Delta(12) fatty acid desaturase [Grifola frondosa]
MATAITTEHFAYTFDRPHRGDDLLEFHPMSRDIKMSRIRSAIPPRLFVRNTVRGIYYVARDVGMAVAAVRVALYIDPFFNCWAAGGPFDPVVIQLARWIAWVVYWWFQGLIFTGILIIGHECGHGALSPNKALCDVIGYITHSILFAPYYSWKITHHHHHMYHGLMEQDEVWVPATRGHLGIPSQTDHDIHYAEYFTDTPIYALFALAGRNLIGLFAYFLFNGSGRNGLSRWTSHFNPLSVMFSKEQRKLVVLSDLGVVVMLVLLYRSYTSWGFVPVFKYYGIPWFLMNHWPFSQYNRTATITYLHHTDPTLPHYRRAEWTFPRGAVATFDRDLLGWMGRFFLHDISHFHVIHHFFPKMPFYHGSEATRYLKEVVGDHYHHSEKSTLKAIWDNYFDCKFVEDTGDILFYRDIRGKAVLKPTAML